MRIYYCAYHLPTQTKHWRVMDADKPLDALLAMDKWNTQAYGTWQYFGVLPGYAAPHDRRMYTESGPDFQE